MQDYLEIIGNEKLKTFKKNINCEIPQNVVGLSTELKGLFLSLAGNGGILVAKDLVSSGKIAQMLSAFNINVKFLTSPYENNFGLVDKNLMFEFISIINDFLNNKINFLIITPDVLFQNIPNIDLIKNNNINLEKNANYDLEKLNKKLTEMGYTRTEFLSGYGQYTLKGDTLQIYPINAENLVKIEFFDDLIEKISLISYENKKFIKNIDNFEIINLNIFNNNELNNNFYNNKLNENIINNYTDNNKLNNKNDDKTNKINNIKNKNNINENNKKIYNILNLSNKIFYDEPKQIFDLAKAYAEVNEYDNFENIFKTNNKSLTAFSSVSGKSFLVFEDYLHFAIEQSKNYTFDFKELLQDVRFYLESGKSVYLFCKNEQNKDRLENFFADNFLFKNNYKDNLIITTDFMPFSANLIDSNAELIGTYNMFKKEKQAIKNAKKNLFIPKINDYVVHETHGVGKCVGVEKLNLNGSLKDYFILEYAGGDKFYLPSEQADTLSAFHTSETAPKLNKLGGVEFAKIKEKVYKNVKELAFDLLKLYAKREKSKGFVYQKDDYLMEQFENAFQFEETPDQLRAIADIKTDMESTKVMDRLVCGDVGFGKTEVALRAIYKAILSGKQVAFLCPTTILSQQHYKTCVERFYGFMVKSARFNRLMPKTEETAVLKGLASGEISVVCGTHKLLSEKVKFKNLGLLVLDEEQRFGVEDKEKIKNLKTDIDVLSLSATPIPRTLHMSLSGIRDISIIDTPPKERQPIQTFITDYDDELLVRACKQELARNGQILIIYNRIDTIYEFAKRVSNLLENARIGVAHGRLSQKQLEDSILKLYSHEYDILISTTLIENGIDLPSANTLIVIDADKLGLSQLYQIRGRIGRSNKTAYAYLTFNGDKKLTDTAYQRLSALMENTSLGSGYKIAMADLDIRGAGNVLGREQHGNLLKVGYDLYYKLLNTAVKEIKGEELQKTREVKLDIALDAYIPETYIQTEDERIKLLSEISEIDGENSVFALKDNLISLYGNIPKVLNNLITLGLIKHFAQKQGARRILINNNASLIYFYEKPDMELTQFGTIDAKINELIEILKK